MTENNSKNAHFWGFRMDEKWPKTTPPFSLRRNKLETLLYIGKKRDLLHVQKPRKQLNSVTHNEEIGLFPKVILTKKYYLYCLETLLHIRGNHDLLHIQKPRKQINLVIHDEKILHCIPSPRSDGRNQMKENRLLGSPPPLRSQTAGREHTKDHRQWEDPKRTFASKY